MERNVNLRIQQPTMLGVNPTPREKLLYISRQLGLDLSKMQGTSFNLFDTVLIQNSSSSRQKMSFFTNTTNKSRNFTNFQNGTLQAGEAMIIEEISFVVLQLSSSNLSSDATNVVRVWNFSTAQYAGFLTNGSALSASMMNLSIANSVVIKNYNIIETNPMYNNRTTGINSVGVYNGNGVSIGESVIGNCVIKTESSPVLPMNQKLEVELEIPPVSVTSGNAAIMCVIGRFGCIFKARTTL
ncbi:MAG: hypothetical protein RML94_09250 [Bacteroidia bacterium]|nr:hypothetical protein [Bacteroidia bacterium]